MRRCKLWLVLLLAGCLLLCAPLSAALSEAGLTEAEEAAEEVWDDENWDDENWDDENWDDEGWDEEDGEAASGESEEAEDSGNAARALVLSNRAAAILFLVLAVLGTGLSAFLLTRRQVPMAWLTFVLVLSMGLMAALCKPVSTEYLPDEVTHYGLAVDFADSFSRPLPECISLFLHYNLGYLPLAAGVLLGSALNLNIYLCGAVLSVLWYAALSALAVWKAPRFRLSFLFFAAMPCCVYLSAGFSYDASIIGCALLGFALVLNAWSRPQERLTYGEALAMCLCLGAGLSPKPAYAALLLLLWFLPQGKFASRGAKWLFRCYALLLLAACLAGSLTGAYDSMMGGDERFEGASMPLQGQYILQHPFAFLRTLGLFVIRSWPGMLLSSPGTIGFLGVRGWLGYALSAALLLCSLYAAGERDTPVLTARRRVLLALLGLLPPLILTVTQYLVSTPVGHDSVAGMQGRYFYPVLPLLLAALSLPRAVRGRIVERSRRWILAAAVLTLLAAGFGYLGSSIYAIRL